MLSLGEGARDLVVDEPALLLSGSCVPKEGKKQGQADEQAPEERCPACEVASRGGAAQGELAKDASKEKRRPTADPRHCGALSQPWLPPANDAEFPLNDHRGAVQRCHDRKEHQPWHPVVDRVRAFRHKQAGDSDESVAREQERPSLANTPQ